MLNESSWDTPSPFSRAEDLFLQACCITLVQSASPAETFSRLGADTSTGATVGLPDLVRASYAHVFSTAGQLAGAAQLGGWTLVLEPNGFACTDRKRMRRASEATTTVTWYRSADVDELTVMANGRRQHFFDLRPRSGGVLHALEQAAGDPWSAPGRAAGTVLVERFSGISLSTRLLGQLELRTGLLGRGCSRGDERADPAEPARPAHAPPRDPRST